MSDNGIVKSLQDYLSVREGHLRQWCKDRIDPIDLVRFGLLQYSESPALQKCTPHSIYLALIGCAQLGLAPDAVRAAIVPYGDTATMQVMVGGYIDLAHRSRHITSVFAHPVYENDVIDVRYGTDPGIDHHPAIRDRGELIAAYAVAHLRDGGSQFELATSEDIEKFRSKAHGTSKPDSPWKVWPDRMATKSVIKRLLRRMPLGDDMRKAVQMDDAAESGDPVKYARIIDVEIEEPEETTKESSGTKKTKDAIKRQQEKQL